MRTLYIQHPVRLLDSLVEAGVFVGEYPRIIQEDRPDPRVRTTVQPQAQAQEKTKIKVRTKPLSKRRMLFALILIFAVTLWSSSLMSAFEAHVIGVTATILAPDLPECDNPGIIVISDVETAQNFDFTGYDVTVTRGGELRPEDLSQPMTVTTNCSLTIDRGGSIRAEDPKDAEVYIQVGEDFTVNGQVSVRGGNGTGKQIGGIVHLDIGGNFILNGELNTSAQETGGTIDGRIGGDMSVYNSGKLMSSAGEGTGTQTGGTIDLTIKGDLSQRGRIAAVGHEEGGKIRMSARSLAHEHGIFDAHGGSGTGVQTGGTIELETTDSNLQSSEDIDASAQEGGGRIRLSSERGVMVTGGILHAEAGSGIGDQTGGAVVIDGTEIIITAKVLAQGDENGGDISVSGSESVTIGGNMDARGGESGTSSQAGGTITISTPTHLEISKSLTAAADDFDGIITLRYCTKDFSGADFDPAPIEESSCGGSSILPLMSESEREEMVAQSENTNESMQESAGGNISGAGVSATENSENASSAPPAEDSAMQNNYELDGETAIVSPESTGDEISPDISQGSGESLLPEEDNAQESGASPEPAGIEPAAPEIALPDTNLQETPLPDSTSQDTDSGSGDADTSGNEPAGREEDSISGEIIIIPDADSGSSGDASSETGNAPSDGA